jgi:regulator of replication initiation timing
MCHELTAEQKNLRLELDKLNQRLDRYKGSFNKEEVNE